MGKLRAATIGVISDTHGLLRPEALAALRGSDLIIHAGDIGSAEVIEGLKSLAPVVAIRGNNDKGKWARSLYETAALRVGRVRLYLIHSLRELGIDPAAAGFQIVVSGHSHRPSVARRDRVLYLNPGSAGPRRFKLPVSVARLRVGENSVNARIVELLAQARTRGRSAGRREELTKFIVDFALTAAYKKRAF